MADLEELEARIRVLEDIEAIKRLKHKYWRCLDNKSWDGVLDCFSEDAVVDYGPNIKLEGKKTLVEELRAKLGGDSWIGIHQGHNPEIDVTSDTTAKGIWELYVHTIWSELNRGLRLGGFYHDEYVKEGGEWKIKSTKMTRIFTESWDRKG